MCCAQKSTSDHDLDKATSLMVSGLSAAAGQQAPRLPHSISSSGNSSKWSMQQEHWPLQVPCLTSQNPVADAFQALRALPKQLKVLQASEEETRQVCAALQVPSTYQRKPPPDLLHATHVLCNSAAHKQAYHPAQPLQQQLQKRKGYGSHCTGLDLRTLVCTEG